MEPAATGCAWILDSGGAGRGAWQGGVLYEFVAWARRHGAMPAISMGASAGGYAAADVATRNDATFLKGWTAWGDPSYPERFPLAPSVAQAWPDSRFRRHFHASIRYVMGPTELSAVFDDAVRHRLVVFTSRVRRRDGRPVTRADLVRLFTMASTRKLPLKYVPRHLDLEPVVFATYLPDELRSEYVRPLTPANYHNVIEASCLIPMAMGPALSPADVDGDGTVYPGDERARFFDGGFTLKMPMGAFVADARLRAVGRWASAPRTLVFCCDPGGQLWETSLRRRALNIDPGVARAIADGTLEVIYPDHPVEAGFLCLDPATTMRTFERGRAQGRRLLETTRMQRFLTGAPPA